MIAVLLAAPDVQCMPLRCDPDSENFELDRALSGDELDQMLEDFEP